MKNILTASIRIIFITTLTGCNFSFLMTQKPNLKVSSIALVPIIQLNWTASSNSPQNYIIEQSTDSVNFTPVQTVGIVTSTTISGLQAKTTYFFRIKANNPAGDSIYSTVIPITTH